VGDSGLPPLGSPEIVVAAPSSPNVVYLGVDLPSRPGTVDGLFASADGGVTWQARSQRLAGGIAGMTVDNLVPTELWAYGSSGLHHSTNGGTTFTPVDDFVGESAGPVDVFRLPGRPPRVLAFMPSRAILLRSDDGGATWLENYSPGVPDSVVHGAAPESVVASSGGDVFAYAAAVFAWIDLRAPRPGVRDLVVDRSANPGFYGRTATTIEVYRGPSGRDIDLSDPDFRIPDITFLGDIPALEPTPNELNPDVTRVRIPAGETRKARYSLLLSKKFTPLDVYLLIDTSHSAKRFLRGLAVELGDIINELRRSRIDVHMGIGEYRAYPDSTPPRPECGSAGSEVLECEHNFVYRRVVDVQGFEGATFETALRGLRAEAGGHYNAPLPALIQAATGRGEDVWPAGPSAHDVPQGAQANFRAGSIRVILNTTDEPFPVRPYARDDFPPDQPGIEEAVQALNDKKIRHVGLALGPGAFVNLQDVSEGTGAVAPSGGVDCDGDGVTDLGHKEPLVCTVRQETLEEGSNLVPAIVGLVEAIRNRGPVELTADGRAGVVASITPEGYPGVAQRTAGRLPFTVTYRCPLSMAGKRTPIDLTARSDSGILATATTTVICGRVPPETFLSQFGLDVLRVLPFVPVSPLPTIPELSSSTQAQSQAQAQGAMAQQRQEQTQVAFAHSYRAALREAIARDEEYAMVSFEDPARRQAPAGVFLAGAAALMSLSYAFAVTAKERIRPRRTRR
ncbi:MAG: glycoside hydrolase, partial [Actinomycetota bacterium]|nr:glycoside hydrolase [Actinomycetota bacterium]